MNSKASGNEEKYEVVDLSEGYPTLHESETKYERRAERKHRKEYSRYPKDILHDATYSYKVLPSHALHVVVIVVNSPKYQKEELPEFSVQPIV